MDEIVQFGYMRFKDFLSESFEPRPTEYGTDLTDLNWKLLDHGFNVTYFKHNNIVFVVLFREGHVGFGISEKPVELNKIQTFAELNKYFVFTPRAVSSAMRIFNIVLYVIGQGISRFKPIEIYFNGSNADLIRLYDKLVKDKSFMTVINNFGYEYTGSEGVLHKFEKV